MNRFKREGFAEWETKSLREKYSFKGKQFWIAMGLVFLIGLIGSFVFPFLPPRYPGNWSPPSTLQEYVDRLVTNLIWTPFLILLVIIWMVLRSLIDLGLGYKRTGEFTITGIANLGSIKILILDNWRLFTIRRRQDYFNDVREGQQIQIKRTGTNRLISYYVHEKE